MLIVTSSCIVSPHWRFRSVSFCFGMQQLWGTPQVSLWTIHLLPISSNVSGNSTGQFILGAWVPTLLSGFGLWQQKYSFCVHCLQKCTIDMTICVREISNKISYNIKIIKKWLKIMPLKYLNPSLDIPQHSKYSCVKSMIFPKSSFSR